MAFIGSVANVPLMGSLRKVHLDVFEFNVILLSSVILFSGPI